MASEGPNFPDTGVNTGTGVAWTNPGNIISENGLVAQATLTDTSTSSQLLEGTDYDFAIPASATIDGILLEVKRRVGLITAGATITDQDVVLVGGGGASSDKADTSTAWPGTLTWKSYGGATDLWGTTWTPAQVNATTFGARLRAQFLIGEAEPPASGRAQVDAYRITVYYTEASGRRMWVTRGI